MEAFKGLDAVERFSSDPCLLYTADAADDLTGVDLGALRRVY
mgnify:CR=1 FL=1